MQIIFDQRIKLLLRTETFFAWYWNILYLLLHE